MAMGAESRRREHIFFLARCNDESRREALKYLREIGVRVTVVHGDVALVGDANDDHVETA